MRILTIIILMIIPIIAVALILNFFVFSSDSAFGKVPKIVEKSEGFIPEEISEEVGSKKIISETQHEQISSLKEAMEKMLASGKKDCFARYDGFSPLVGTSILMTYDTETKETLFEVKGGEGGQQIITDLRFNFKMKPCVIAGRNSVTENFWKKFISQENTALLGGYYYGVNEIKIRYDSGKLAGVGCSSGNRILAANLPSGTVNDECNNLEDGGFLFKASDKNICFFPTIVGTTTDYDDDGIDDKYISGQGENGLNKRYGSTITKCY